MERGLILAALAVVVSAAIAGATAANANATAIFGFASMVSLSLIALLKVEKVHADVREVKVLVNSVHGAALRAAAISARRLAILTHDEADQVLAETAERLYLDHQRQQAVVDQGVSHAGDH